MIYFTGCKAEPIQITLSIKCQLKNMQEWTFPCGPPLIS